MARRRSLLPLFSLLLLTLLTLACGSVGVSGNQGSAQLNGSDIDRSSTTDFDVEIAQPSESTIMPQLKQYNVKYEITIYNHTDVPVKVRRVVMQSVGSGSDLPPSTRSYGKTIGPHGSEKIEFWALVTIADQQLPRLPSIVRTTVDFDAGGASRREHFTRNVGGGGYVAWHG